MWPVLFRIPLPWGDPNTYFPIRMFGVMVILGFLAGQWVVGRRLKGRKILDTQETFDFCFYLLAVGILGSRLMYVIQEFEQFRGKFFQTFAIWQGGLVWYGGFIAAALFAFWWLWKKKLPVLEVSDAAVLGLALALAVGRIGCFCAGDDYGKYIVAEDGTPIVSEEHAPWYAIQVPNESTETNWRYAYTETPPSFRAPNWLHPTQLYMSLSNLVVFGGLLLIAGWATRPGVLTASYFLLYPPARFVVEFWRGDVDRGVDVMGTGLSFSQFLGIPIFAVGLLMLRGALKRTPDKTA